MIQHNAVAIGRIGEQKIESRVAWRDRMILLDGETVAEAVEEFNRYRMVPIVIGDARVARLRIGGRFRTDESPAFVESLNQTFPVKSLYNDDGSVILTYADETV